MQLETPKLSTPKVFSHSCGGLGLIRLCSLSGLNAGAHSMVYEFKERLENRWPEYQVPEVAGMHEVAVCNYSLACFSCLYPKSF